MQKLNVSLQVTIPESMILIQKVEYEYLKEMELKGVYWNMKDLEKHTNKKSEWIKEKILYPRKFRRILDSDYGGFVYYPKSKGQNWTFQASEMSNFLEKNFNSIFKQT